MQCPMKQTGESIIEAVSTIEVVVSRVEGVAFRVVDATWGD